MTPEVHEGRAEVARKQGTHTMRHHQEAERSDWKHGMGFEPQNLPIVTFIASF